MYLEVATVLPDILEPEEEARGGMRRGREVVREVSSTLLLRLRSLVPLDRSAVTVKTLGLLEAVA
jgi:hypothetical protein